MAKIEKHPERVRSASSVYGQSTLLASLAVGAEYIHKIVNVLGSDGKAC